VFDEGVFFGPGSATASPEAERILRVMADNMRNDVPDVRVTLLGHTDASGSDASNESLSLRRAQNVLQTLVVDGVNPGQLGTVAVGRNQPIAPNDTAAGRARNRRVEFLISPSEVANLYVVSTRPVNQTFLRVDAATSVPPRPQEVEFLKPTYSGPADFSEGPPAERQIRLAEVSKLPLRGDIEETGSPIARTPVGIRSDAPLSGSPAAPVE
jgi:hypothetical protein